MLNRNAQMYNSSVENVGLVTFPKFKPERIYMQKFFKNSGLPKKYSHWQDTIDQMIATVDTDQPMYLMVDSGMVKANNTHRRSGLHIDGYWIDTEDMQCWGNTPPRWNPKHDNEILSCHAPTPPHHWSKPTYDGKKPNWNEAELKHPEALILASSYTSSRGFVGQWDGFIGDGGACDTVDTSNMKEVILKKNNVYISNVGFLHESLPVQEDVERTLIRISVKNWELH